MMPGRLGTHRALLAALLFAGCGGGASELLETAKFEELQRNSTHARELYQRILRDYPQAPEAQTAAEHLRALEAVP
jgi:TolA-binding protein